jgi:hypothetical protein
MSALEHSAGFCATVGMVSEENGRNAVNSFLPDAPEGLLLKSFLRQTEKMSLKGCYLNASSILQK